MSDVNAIKETLLGILKKEFKEIPSTLIDKILTVQTENSQNKSEGMIKIGKIIEDYINEQEFN